jgi:hypothetical protein
MKVFVATGMTNVTDAGSDDARVIPAKKTTYAEAIIRSRDQVPPDPASLAAPERQGRALTAHRSGRVLSDGRSEESRPLATAPGLAGLLQPVPPSWGATGSCTPWQTWLDKLAMTPFHDEVETNFDASAERIRHPDYRMDLKLAGHKSRNRLS